MNRWAASGKYADCNFLCICVLGDSSAVGLAKEFGQQMKLTHCVNGFVTNEAGLPEYGQLGCRGFIVLDEEHRVVSRMTSPFMEVRNLAFKHVEVLLDAVTSKSPLPKVCPGESVEIIEAPSELPQLKGEKGMVVEQRGDDAGVAMLFGRFRGRVMKVPVRMLAKLYDEDEEMSEEEGAPQGGQGVVMSCGPGGCGPGAVCVPKGGCDKEVCDEQGGCGQGDGCDKATCDKVDEPMATEEALDGDFVAEALQLKSVKVASMDAEHDECASALRLLVSEPTPASLQAVLRCLSEHFEHEEALFEQVGFGAHAQERFSAKKTHIEDHRRILSKVQQKLASGEARVPAAFLRELLQDFHEHTSRYDVQYSDACIAAGAQ